MQQIKNLTPITEKRFSRIEKDFTEAKEKVIALTDRIEDFTSIILSKIVKIPLNSDGNKKESEKRGSKNKTFEESNSASLYREVKLLPAEVKGFRLELKKSKLDLRLARRDLNSNAKVYKDACLRNSKVVLLKNKTLSEQIEAERKARKEAEISKQKVIKMVQDLKSKEDPRLIKLADFALTDGKEFRKQMDDLLETEDKLVLTTISGLSPVKTDVYREVRKYFGWNPDEDEQTVDTEG